MSDVDNPSHSPRTSILRGIFHLVLLVVAALLWLFAAIPLVLFALLFGQRVRLRVIMAMTGPFCRTMAAAIGLRVRVEGERREDLFVFVGNHVSWLDILTAGVAVSGVFVSRHDVKDWPGIGLFARLAGTVFIDRTSLRSAIASSQSIVDRAQQGIRVVFFPEGGATNGDTVESFKVFLFGDLAKESLVVQPLTILYTEVGGLPVTPKNREMVYWYSPDQSCASHVWTLLKTSGVEAVVRFREPASPPAEVDREGLREYVESLREQTAEDVPVWQERESIS